tara:strand:- start:75 stop:653 length:579 start_codon:yes stop_codon:yes gene_type:complete
MAFFRAIDFNPSRRGGRMGRGFPGGGGIGGLLGRIVNRTRGRMPRPIRRPMPMPIGRPMLPMFGPLEPPQRFLPSMPMPQMPMPMPMPQMPMPMPQMPMPSMPPMRPGYIPQIDPVALQELQDRMANASPPPVVPDRPQQFNPSFFRNLIDSTSEQKQAFERFQERMRNRDPDEPLKMRPYQPGRLGSRMIG